MKISDLQDKTIININNGKELGKISDLEIDEKGIIINYYALYKKNRGGCNTCPNRLNRL